MEVDNINKLKSKQILNQKKRMDMEDKAQFTTDITQHTNAALSKCYPLDETKQY